MRINERSYPECKVTGQATTLQMVAKKPNLAIRILASLGLLFALFLTFPIRIAHHILSRENRHKMALYNQLHRLAKEGNQEGIRSFLKRHINHQSIGFLFNDLLHLPELHSDLAEILQGANVCIKGDNGFFFKRWKSHPTAYQRISSHDYQEDECYAIGHLLFWLSPKGNTHFQFEKSPLKGLSIFEHGVDYLRYRRDNQQQGPAGISFHTENYCLNYQTIDPHKFRNRISC